MKAIIKILFAVLLVTATGVYAQRGYADVQRGYGWPRTGVNGQISKLVWGGDLEGSHPLPTGPHIVYVGGRATQIWVLRVKVDGSYLVRFKRGFYSSYTANWVKVYRGQALWGYGVEPIFRKGLDGATYITNAEALDECGNPVAQVMRASCASAPTVVVGGNGNGNGGNFNTGGNTDTTIPTSTTSTTTTIPVAQWPGMTTQPSVNNTTFSTSNTGENWWNKHWAKVVGPVLISTGGYLLYRGIHPPRPTTIPQFGHESNTGVVGTTNSSGNGWKIGLGAGLAGIGLGITIAF